MFLVFISDRVVAVVVVALVISASHVRLAGQVAPTSANK